ncbi:MAG TPA: nickel pincer cofactor biosynthesis protein LarC, partial [Candidatus Binatus sp.]|nr:nickel pincer cofactor biosynthesis protein LarC [Candidatus Binatus sp.]
MTTKTSSRNKDAGLIVVADSGVSGVSGDKYLGALVSLGANPARLKKAAEIIQSSNPGLGKAHIQIEKQERGEIGSTLVHIEASRDNYHDKRGILIRNIIEKTGIKLRLSDWAQGFTLATADSLLDAESRVHGHDRNQVVLHELGSIDTLVDILGTAAMIEELGLDNVPWVSTPVAVGGGTARFSGKHYPNPPPAVVEILRRNKFPLIGGYEKSELTTPTGAAITVNLARSVVDTYPAMIPVKVGYGAGARELEETANLLRLTIGQSLRNNHGHDNMVILETNLDDVTGEVIGHAVETLLSEGARDVTVTPVYMKKNRPGSMISVIVEEARSEKFASLLMRETGT